MANLVRLAVATTLSVLAGNAWSNSVQEGPPFFVRTNQLGYLPDDPKIGITFAADAVPAAFEIVDVNSRVVLRGQVTRPEVQRWAEFGAHGELDFSDVRAPGRYRVRFPEAGVESHWFTVGVDVFASAADVMLGFLRQQRCGYNPTLDAVCHRFDGRTADGPRPAGAYLPAHGGWHDAGDTLKYLLTASNATAQLLLAYTVAPDIWQDRTNAHGQPGANGRVDVLDEARWGLDWLLRLHPSRDELYHMVGDDRDHSGWRLPQA